MFLLLYNDKTDRLTCFGDENGAAELKKVAKKTVANTDAEYMELTTEEMKVLITSVKFGLKFIEEN